MYLYIQSPYYNVHTCVWYVHTLFVLGTYMIHTCTYIVITCICMYIPFTDISYYVLPRWTQEELKKVIAMLHCPEFDSKGIDPDLHKRMDKAVQDVCIKGFNMRESYADGGQDLLLWAHGIEDVVLEIMEDPVFKGSQNFKFEMDLDGARPMLEWHHRGANGCKLG